MLTRHIRESLQVTPGPIPDFWAGPGDEASAEPISSKRIAPTDKIRPNFGDNYSRHS